MHFRILLDQNLIFVETGADILTDWALRSPGRINLLRGPRSGVELWASTTERRKLYTSAREIASGKLRRMAILLGKGAG
jgi:hypothetical protein